ncbi:cytochrome c oxidase assembly protein [Herbiconiux solani]|uniref:cytochrome c oxidase assembly protein n=1 Tax=Herbiconiux solani TaxID=661329 RepID=UPI0009FE481D|nr:cytochrome c oxidase assembly protein [Herbiconiux solani]
MRRPRAATREATTPRGDARTNEETTTPDILTALSIWRFDPVAALIILALAAAYLAAVRRFERSGDRWPRRRTLGFVLLGLGSFAVVEFGFPGAESADLRYAFSTRIALLLFLVPAMLATGRPLELAAGTLRGRPLALLTGASSSRFARITGNAVFGTILALVVFAGFLTPLAGIARTTPWISESLGLLIPLLGAIVVIPLAGAAALQTGLFIAAEFLLAFAELVLDAIPGIVLRLSGTVLDGVGPLLGGPSWFPDALRDQQLSGDLLWFIAEIADIPVLVFLFIRWSRHDRREAKSLDDLSDDEMDALTAAHLRSGRSGSGDSGVGFSGAPTESP